VILLFLGKEETRCSITKMLAFLLLSILLTLSEASATPGKIEVPKAFTKVLDDCSGLGCREWYAAQKKDWGTPARKMEWKDKFDECANFKDGTLPNLQPDKWENVIDRHMPGLLDIDLAVKSTSITPETSAVSLGTLKLLLKVATDMTTPGEVGALKEGDTGYKNPRSPTPNTMLPSDKITMHDINQFLVKPVTRGFSVSFAHIMLGRYVDADGNYDHSGKNGGPAVGKITHFISHEWGAPFKNFVAIAENHCKTLNCDPAKTYYWVCTFANNQHDISVSKANVETESPFGIALAANPVSVLAIQWDGPQPMMSISRIWCVFEMALVLKLKLKLYWGCGDKTTLLESRAKSACGPASNELLKNFTPSNAGYTKKEDYDDILAWIDKTTLLCDKPGLTANTPQECLAEIFNKFADTGAVEGTYFNARAEVKTGESSAMPIMSSIYLHATFTILSLFVILRYVCASSKESTVDIHYGLLEAEI